MPLLLWLLAAKKKKLQHLRPHQLPHLLLLLLPHLLLKLLLAPLRLPLAPLRLLLVPLRLPLAPQTQRRSNSLQRVEKSRRKAAFFMVHTFMVHTVHDFPVACPGPGNGCFVMSRCQICSQQLPSSGFATMMSSGAQDKACAMTS